MREYDAHFSSLLNTCTGGARVFRNPDFAATILNLICAEISLTARWLPSGHSYNRGIFLHFERKRLVSTVGSDNRSNALSCTGGGPKGETARRLFPIGLALHIEIDSTVSKTYVTAVTA
jgi:hypothetical protein